MDNVYKLIHHNMLELEQSLMTHDTLIIRYYDALTTPYDTILWYLTIPDYDTIILYYDTLWYLNYTIRSVFIILNRKFPI